jgi:hypothetical protein
LLDHIEDHLWTDTEEGGDIWNGRWRPLLLDTILNIPADFSVPTRDFQLAFKWIQELTLLLQTTQRALYSARHIERLSQEAQARHAHVLTLRRKRHTRRTRTLFEAWKIPYSKPQHPRRRHTPPAVIVPPATLNPTAQRWLQYSRTIKHTSTNHFAPFPPPTNPTTKQSKREDHRTMKLKLRKLRNIILLCR